MPSISLIGDIHKSLRNLINLFRIDEVHFQGYTINELVNILIADLHIKKMYLVLKGLRS